MRTPVFRGMAAFDRATRKARAAARAQRLAGQLGRLAGAGCGRHVARRDCVSAMLVAIVDYQSGNLHSAAKAFERAARESGIAAEIAVTSDPGTVLRADRVVLPGVGAFGDCYRGLAATP